MILALPSWDDYLSTSLDDLIEAGAGSPMVLLRARSLLTTLLAGAGPPGRASITWRLDRVQDLLAGNFPAIWRNATSKDQDRRRTLPSQPHWPPSG